MLRPLRAVLGAFVAARSQNAAVEGTALQLDPAARRAPAGADRVRTAECALACMLLLLERCPVFELSQVRHNLALPPSAVRGCVLTDCFRLASSWTFCMYWRCYYRCRTTCVTCLLKRLSRCVTNGRCACCVTPAVCPRLVAWPHQVGLEEVRLSTVRALTALVNTGAASALQEAAQAPLLGHVMSLLLQVADQEAAAGDRGSRTLRADALRALDAVLRKARPMPPGVYTSRRLGVAC